MKRNHIKEIQSNLATALELSDELHLCLLSLEIIIEVDNQTDVDKIYYLDIYNDDNGHSINLQFCDIDEMINQIITYLKSMTSGFEISIDELHSKICCENSLSLLTPFNGLDIYIEVIDGNFNMWTNNPLHKINNGKFKITDFKIAKKRVYDFYCDLLNNIFKLNEFA